MPQTFYSCNLRIIVITLIAYGRLLIIPEKTSYKLQTRLKRLVKHKRSSLLQKLVNYAGINMYNVGSWCDFHPILLFEGKAVAYQSGAR
jgi:hypothetical protein